MNRMWESLCEKAGAETHVSGERIVGTALDLVYDMLQDLTVNDDETECTTVELVDLLMQILADALAYWCTMGVAAVKEGVITVRDMG